ncbi:MAG: hypothetical protein RIE58_12035 [Vicingaceae bacterium]
MNRPFSHKNITIVEKTKAVLKSNRFILSIPLLLVFVSCKVGRFVAYNFADINDHKKFPARTIENDGTKFHFGETEKGKVPVLE